MARVQSCGWVTNAPTFVNVWLICRVLTKHRSRQTPKKEPPVDSAPSPRPLLNPILITVLHIWMAYMQSGDRYGLFSGLFAANAPGRPKISATGREQNAACATVSGTCPMLGLARLASPGTYPFPEQVFGPRARLRTRQREEPRRAFGIGRSSSLASATSPGTFPFSCGD